MVVIFFLRSKNFVSFGIGNALLTLHCIVKHRAGSGVLSFPLLNAHASFHLSSCFLFFFLCMFLFLLLLWLLLLLLSLYYFRWLGLQFFFFFLLSLSLSLHFHQIEVFLLICFYVAVINHPAVKYVEHKKAD